jgi:hypothetical protein
MTQLVVLVRWGGRIVGIHARLGFVACGLDSLTRDGHILFVYG